ncbi:hypothetical protein BDV93DRAFT_214287 [Ceratobasidium sp. AG-I]|nr:hypothetical protein BDV93DRAFT_214287 [Ceratobasidium sp. AG-I]
MSGAAGGVARVEQYANALKWRLGRCGRRFRTVLKGLQAHEANLRVYPARAMHEKHGAGGDKRVDGRRGWPYTAYIRGRQGNEGTGRTRFIPRLLYAGAARSKSCVNVKLLCGPSSSSLLSEWPKINERRELAFAARTAFHSPDRGKKVMVHRYGGGVVVWGEIRNDHGLDGDDDEAGVLATQGDLVWTLRWLR